MGNDEFTVEFIWNIQKAASVLILTNAKYMIINGLLTRTKKSIQYYIHA